MWHFGTMVAVKRRPWNVSGIKFYSWMYLVGWLVDIWFTYDLLNINYLIKVNVLFTPVFTFTG